MTARPPFSTVLQTKDFAVVLRLTVRPEPVCVRESCFRGAGRSPRSPELAAHSRPQEPQPGKPPHELQRILEQLALEEDLFDESGVLAVGPCMAYAIDGSHERQWLERPASSRQIFADENM